MANRKAVSIGINDDFYEVCKVAAEADGMSFAGWANMAMITYLRKWRDPVTGERAKEILEQRTDG